MKNVLHVRMVFALMSADFECVKVAFEVAESIGKVAMAWFCT